MKVRSRQYYFSNYYKVSNGIYNSYWLGKLSNVFMFSGNKKTIDTAIKNTFSFLKLKYNVSPLEIILEGLEKIKPVFSLKYVTIAGKRREFPKLLSKHKQFQMSVAWLHHLVLVRKEYLLSRRMFNEIQDLRMIKKHTLVKRRDNLLVSAVETRFNTRFTY